MPDDEPEYREYEDEDGRPSVGLVLHEFEIRGESEDTLYIYKQISKEAAQAILEEMPHIVKDDVGNN